MRRRFGWFCSLAALALIAATTMVPLATGDQTPPRWLQRPSVGDLLRNLILYLPFGFGLVRAGLQRRTAVAVAFVLSSTVELAQISIIAGRDASLNDVFSNTVGSALGAWIATYWPVVLFPRPPVRTRLFLATAASVFAILFASSMALRPSLPSGHYRVRWAPQGNGQDWFHGQLLRASVNGKEIPNNGSPTTAPERSWLARGIGVNAVFTPGQPLTEESTIFGLADSTHNVEIIELAQAGADLRFRARTVAARAGLASPTISLRGGLAIGDVIAPSDTLQVQASMIGGQLHLTLGNRHNLRSSALTLSPSLGWITLSPWVGWDAGALQFASTLWLLILLFPLGYWGARLSGASYRDYGIVASVLFLGLFAAPLLEGSHIGTWRDWAIGVAAVALGAWTRDRMRDPEIPATEIDANFRAGGSSSK